MQDKEHASMVIAPVQRTILYNKGIVTRPPSSRLVTTRNSSRARFAPSTSPTTSTLFQPILAPLFLSLPYFDRIFFFPLIISIKFALRLLVIFFFQHTFRSTPNIILYLSILYIFLSSLLQ